MSETIKIKRGLSVLLQGEADEVCLSPSGKSERYALIPEDFTGVVPKLAVKVGDKVKAGDALFYHKRFPEMKFVAPISGEVVEVARGAKRKILSIELIPEKTTEESPSNLSETTFPLASASREEVKNHLLASGLWGFIRQRPYDIVAEPDKTPRDIFVTAHFTAPLAPRFSYLLEQEANREYLTTALKALQKLTDGDVYLGVETPLGLGVEGIKEYVTKGPHPAGSVGVLINYTKPVNKGEIVWTLKATDLLVMGRYLTTGRPDFSRQVLVTGSEATERGYVTLTPGCQLAKEIESTIPATSEKHLRLINGDVLTGKKIDEERPFASLDIDQTTLIPEGDDVHELFGWIAPRLNHFSISKTYLAWLRKNKRYRIDARLKGGERHMIMSGEFHKVFPLDIMPEALLKAIIAFNIDKMEALGIYEVAPEDFALCEFVDSSKQELQQIVRHGLDMLYKEMN